MTNLLKKIALGTMIGAAALTGCEYAQPRHDTNSSMYDAGMLLVAAGNVNMINAKTQKQAMHGSAAADLGRVISNRAAQIDSANIIANEMRQDRAARENADSGADSKWTDKLPKIYVGHDENGDNVVDLAEGRQSREFFADEAVIFVYEAPRNGKIKFAVYGPDGDLMREDSFDGLARYRYARGPPVAKNGGNGNGNLRPGLYHAKYFFDGVLDAEATARVITRP